MPATQKVFRLKKKKNPHLLPVFPFGRAPSFRTDAAMKRKKIFFPFNYLLRFFVCSGVKIGLHYTECASDILVN